MATAINQAKETSSASLRHFGANWNRFWFMPMDVYTLCVIRILTGVIALYFLITFTPDLIHLFGSGGLLPIEMVKDFRDPIRVSYFDVLSKPVELYAAHAVGIAIVAAMTLGFYTRVTSVLSLFVVLSYIHRAPMITSQIELVLAMLLFYLCLAPVGTRLSVDHWLARRKADGKPKMLDDLEMAGRSSLAATIVTRLMQIHLVLIYLMMALAKLNDGSPVDFEPYYYHAWWSGEAVWWLAAKPSSSLVDLTGLLTDSMYLVNAWTLAIVVFEIAFVLLIWNRIARPLLLWAAVPMWLSLAVITGLPLFCGAMLVANLAFVGPDVMRSFCWKNPNPETFS